MMSILSNEALKKLIKENSTFEIEEQDVEDGNTQVAVWAKTFGKPWIICYQNGDMNGDQQGIPIFTNPGANDGLLELRSILEDREEFRHLIDYTTFWEYEALDNLIHDFCEDFAEENKIADTIKQETTSNDEEMED